MAIFAENRKIVQMFCTVNLWVNSVMYLKASFRIAELTTKIGVLQGFLSQIPPKGTLEIFVVGF